MTWYMSNISYISKMDQLNPTVTKNAFGGATSFAISTNYANPGMKPAGYATTPLLKYTSYATLETDICMNRISPVYKWLMYDNEDWDQTPSKEIDNPWMYMHSFIQLAHTHGYQVVCAPGRDLGNSATSVKPKQNGETLDSWYLRTEIPGTCATFSADVVHVQTQADTLDLYAFDALWEGARDQVGAFIPTSVGVSTNYGTPEQMDTALRSINGYSGVWLNTSTVDCDKAVQFLALQMGS